MPSPRRTLSSSSTSESTNDKQDVTDIPKPLWNSAPNELPPFLIKLGEWLMQDADFESLITNGTVLSRNQVCCVNQNHLDRCSRDLIARAASVIVQYVLPFPSGARALALDGIAQ